MIVGGYQIPAHLVGDVPLVGVLDVVGGRDVVEFPKVGILDGVLLLPLCLVVGVLVRLWWVCCNVGQGLLKVLLVWPGRFPV